MSELHPIAVLTRRDATRFELRVRWLLGDGTDLPRPDDAFDVTIRRTDIDRYLQQNGTFATVAGEQKIRVQPKPFAMIDPPRKEVPFPANPSRTWDVATKPTKPIDCITQLVDKIVDGFGICHLLSETQQSRVQARTERVLAPHVSRAMQGLAARAGFDAAAETLDVTAIAATTRELAEMLVRRAPRPIDLQPRLVEEHAMLVEATAAVARGERSLEEPHPLTLFGDRGLPDQWRRAALAFELFGNVEVLEALDAVITPPTQVREQLRLRALQGGRLIDYWCSPESKRTTCANDDDRGRQHLAAELIGTGFSIGAFTAAEIQQWIDANANLEVHVEHIRTIEQPIARLADDETVADVFTADDRAFDAKTFELTTTGLRLALASGSSLAPVAPVSANVNYDFLQTNAGAETEPQLAYSTGEARVEIVITPNESQTASKMVFGFNVYGMWETSSTKRFFDDPALQPTPAELRPWLITRKYSYERDLKDAFPKAGATHPAIVRALEDPPWQAVLLRPTEVFSGNSLALPDPNGPAPRPVKLPDVFRIATNGTRQTHFALDLRMGQSSGLGTFVGWDPEGMLRQDWDPTKTREGTAAGVRPQRYRFWVTAIDAFDQESVAVNVLANDIDAGEASSPLFSPHFRASLLPPTGRTLEVATKPNNAFTITAKWDTPFLNDVGRNDTEPQRRANKEHLLGAVKLFRRRLRRKIEEVPSRAFATLALARAAGDIFSLPQWIEAVQRMTADGWQECGSASDVKAPQNGEIWSHSFDFGHEGRGFEYLALTGLQVRLDRAVFWHPDVVTISPSTGRRAFLAVKSGDDWQAISDRITETPRTTTAVPTENWIDGAKTTAGALPIPNLAEPRGVTLAASRFHRANPILPPPGIGRDLVLQRLLTRAVGVNGTADARQSWLDSGFELTTAQAAMLEAALERTAEEAGIADPLHDSRLHDARVILARELIAKDDGGTSYRQTSTIGFRGLAELRWSYAPFAAKAPRVDEAEAEKVRIFAVRAPMEAKAAAQYATVRAKGTLAAGQYTLTAITAEQQPALATIEQFRRPTLVRIDGAANTAPLFGALTEIVTAAGTTKIRVAVTSGTLPANATISLYAAQPLVDREILDHEFESEQTTFLPIGGGHAEVFGWWLQTLSAQEVVSRHAEARQPFFISTFVPTIEPIAPMGFAVNLPLASSAAFALHPVNDRQWLPTSIINEHQSQHAPRVIASWNAYDPAEQAGIEIEREERLVERELLERTARALAITPWEAIKAINELADGTLLAQPWIDAIRGNWLLGKEVDIPDEDVSGTKSILIAATTNRPLSGATGVKLVDGRPSFIDYFRNGGNSAAAMDGNYEYRYRVRAWIDTLPGIPPQQSTSFRFLRSGVTPWTDWIVPEPGEATIRPSASTFTLHDKDTPAVRFRLAATGNPAAAPADGWFYRIVVKRVLDYSLPSTENVKLAPRWREVGTPIVLPPNGSLVELNDLLIERPDVDERVTVAYQISARQLVLTPTGRERVIRTLPDANVSVTIEPPPDPAARERLATMEVTIA